MDTAFETAAETAVGAVIKANPFDKTILLSVTVRSLGVTRKVKSDQVSVDTDKDLLRVSKKIIDCSEFAAIQSAVATLKKYLWNKCVPGVQFIKGGIYPIPLARVEEIDAKVNEMIGVYNGCVAKFLEVYEARAEECRDRLRILGDATEYPPADKVRQSFGIRTEYITLGPPGSLQGVSKEIYQRETQRIREECQNAATQVRDAMRGMLQEMLTHTIDRLTPTPDGKQKIFKKSMLGNINEFLDSFQDRNITDDEEMAKLVSQMRGIVAGKSADSLRTDDAARKDVAKQMSQVKSALDAMLTDKPTRAIMIDD